ncbi:MAG: hypothetical protein ACO3LT_09755, partial [Ilumatobacteraceae bacterium]
PGDSVTYDGNGRALHTVIWRGPIHRLPAFRNAVPLQSPDFGGLKLAAPPSEYHEGAYARVVAQYGGISNEVSGNFPNDIDNDDPDVPTTTLSLDFQVSSVVMSIVDPDFSPSSATSGEFRVDYRAPVNTINYVTSSKPARVSGKARSGITSEADPKILSVAPLNTVASQYVVLSGAESAVKLLQTKYAPAGADPRWKIETAAVAFRRNSNSQFWSCSETWTKLIVQADNDENFDEG